MHAIRLREPWEVERSAGMTRYRRWFNKPTGLAEGDAVWLVIEQFQNGIQVMLNSEPLGEPNDDRPAAWSIGKQLRPRNCVLVEVAEGLGSTDRPFGEVRLEIESSA